MILRMPYALGVGLVEVGDDDLRKEGLRRPVVVEAAAIHQRAYAVGDHDLSKEGLRAPVKVSPGPRV